MKFLPLAASVFGVVLMTAPYASAAITPFDRPFLKADINSDLQLTLDEFMITLGRRGAWTEAQHKFTATDTSVDGFLSLTEFRATKGGRKIRRASKAETFRLADADQNGELSLEEFANTLPNTWAYAVSGRRFSRVDRSDDGLISWREFGLRADPWNAPS